jgi:hypothetical protein
MLQEKRGEALKVYHSQVCGFLSCRRIYFKAFPEKLHYKFNNAWFTASDLKKGLELPPKAIENIKKTYIYIYIYIIYELL